MLKDIGHLICGHYGEYKKKQIGCAITDSEMEYMLKEAGCGEYGCRSLSLFIGNSQMPKYIWRAAVSQPKNAWTASTGNIHVIYAPCTLNNLYHVRQIVGFPFLDDKDFEAYLSGERELAPEMPSARKTYAVTKIPDGIMENLSCYCAAQVMAHKKKFLYIMVPENVDYLGYCMDVIVQILKPIPGGLRKNFSFATGPSVAEELKYGIIFKKDNAKMPRRINEIRLGQALEEKFLAKNCFLNDIYIRNIILSCAKDNGKRRECLNIEENYVMNAYQKPEAVLIKEFPLSIYRISADEDRLVPSIKQELMVIQPEPNKYGKNFQEDLCDFLLSKASALGQDTVAKFYSLLTYHTDKFEDWFYVYSRNRSFQAIEENPSAEVVKEVLSGMGNQCKILGKFFLDVEDILYQAYLDMPRKQLRSYDIKQVIEILKRYSGPEGLSGKLEGWYSDMDFSEKSPRRKEKKEHKKLPDDFILLIVVGIIILFLFLVLYLMLIVT